LGAATAGHVPTAIVAALGSHQKGEAVASSSANSARGIVVLLFAAEHSKTACILHIQKHLIPAKWFHFGVGAQDEGMDSTPQTRLAAILLDLHTEKRLLTVKLEAQRRMGEPTKALERELAVNQGESSAFMAFLDSIK